MRTMVAGVPLRSPSRAFTTYVPAGTAVRSLWHPGVEVVPAQRMLNCKVCCGSSVRVSVP